ncbi:PHO85 cyclin-1, partial [Massospora cicadina]
MVIASVTYLRRLRTHHPNWVVCQSPCLLFTVCLSLAFKFLQDAPHFTMVWARFSGFSAKQINVAEAQALVILDYQLQIHPHVHQSWQAHFKSNYQANHPPTHPIFPLPLPSLYSPILCRSAMRRKHTLPSQAIPMPLGPYLPHPIAF